MSPTARCADASPPSLRSTALALFAGGAASACGFAALGVALHGQAGTLAAPALLYGAFGLAGGMFCAALEHRGQRPAAASASAAAGRPAAVAPNGHGPSLSAGTLAA